MMGFGYLISILLAIGAMAQIDRRFSLLVFRAPRRALLVLGIGTAAFLVWDVICIQLGIFGRGSGPFLTGWEIIPHLTVEEPFFLWFLCYFTMIVFTGAQRLLGPAGQRRSPGPDGPGRPARPDEAARADDGPAPRRTGDAS